MFSAIAVDTFEFVIQLQIVPERLEPILQEPGSKNLIV